jgi:hypothetical protein
MVLYVCNDVKVPQVLNPIISMVYSFSYCRLLWGCGLLNISKYGLPLLSTLSFSLLFAVSCYCTQLNSLSAIFHLRFPISSLFPNADGLMLACPWHDIPTVIQSIKSRINSFHDVPQNILSYCFAADPCDFSHRSNGLQSPKGPPRNHLCRI